MISFFRKKPHPPTKQASPLELPLTSIKEIDRAGILYIDANGSTAMIRYAKAHRCWCQHYRQSNFSKPKYICDRTKAQGWKILFYTDFPITFTADASQEELWISVLNRVYLQGYRSFDLD